MLNYVHHLVANCACLLFLESAVPKNNTMRPVAVNQNSKVAAGPLNNEQKLAIKLCKAKGSDRIADNS